MTHGQVRRRVMEEYGQRPTVKDAVRRVLRSMVDWGVLSDTKTPDTKRNNGMYRPGILLSISRDELIAWLVEALLHARAHNSIALQAVLDFSSLFPFHIKPISADRLAAVSGRLDVMRYGLDQEMIILRE